MQPTRALSAIESVAHRHRGGHRCIDGNWYNDNAGARVACGTLTALRGAADDVRRLHAQVHDAAHDPEAVDAVMSAMLSTPVEDIDPGERDPWRHLTRLAIEGLAHHLDQDTSPEARRAEAAAALIRERVGFITNP